MHVHRAVTKVVAIATVLLSTAALTSRSQSPRRLIGDSSARRAVSTLPVSADSARAIASRLYPALRLAAGDSVSAVWILADSSGRVHASAVRVSPDSASDVAALEDRPSVIRRQLFERFDPTTPVTDFIETVFQPAHERQVVVHWIQILGEPRPRQ